MHGRGGAGCRWIRLAALAALAALGAGVSGCAKVGLKGGPPTDRLRIASGAVLNDCDGSGSRPVVLRVYVLAAEEKFKDLDLESLWYGEPPPLGQDLIGAVKEVTAVAGAARPALLALPREQGAVAVGVVANFCEIAPGCWKKIIPLAKGNTNIDILLERTCMTVTVAP